MNHWQRTAQRFLKPVTETIITNIVALAWQLSLILNTVYDINQGSPAVINFLFFSFKDVNSLTLGFFGPNRHVFLSMEDMGQFCSLTFNLISSPAVFDSWWILSND